MNLFVILLSLSVLMASQASVLKAPVNRTNLSVGYIGPGDRHLYRTYIYQPAIANSFQYQDVIWRGNITNRISAVSAQEVGGTQYASALILSGGVGASHVTVRFQSARGWGYYYLFDVWGR